MEVSKRPSKKEILSLINEIESLELAKVEIDDIKKLLDPLFTGYVIQAPLIGPGLIIYRGIQWDDKPVQLSNISYPPEEHAKINRASRENHPVFYCGNMESIPVFELGLTPGQKLVVSKWKSKKQMKLSQIGYTDSNFVSLKSNRTRPVWDQTNISTLREFYLRASEEENILIQNFFARNFCQQVPRDQSDLYKITIAIGECHFQHDLFDALIYPTIQMRANADNFAIKKNFCDSGGLQFEEIYFMEIKDFDLKRFEYNLNRLDWANSISKSGEIEWKGRMPQWPPVQTGESRTATSENGVWTIQDEKGNILKPY